MSETTQLDLKDQEIRELKKNVKNLKDGIDSLCFTKRIDRKRIKELEENIEGLFIRGEQWLADEKSKWHRRG